MSDKANQKRSRYLGCLLGGAVGDALGYPVEFMEIETIHSAYGTKGIRKLEQAGRPAVISDDTQMTLFAANGMICRLLGADEDVSLDAYYEWLGTQGDKRYVEDEKKPKMWLYNEKRLHVRRAPGNTCLSALMSGKKGTAALPLNDSKGCGTIMRAAPFGLAVRSDDECPNDKVYRLAVSDAALTHGHRDAWESSYILSQIIYNIVQKRPEHNYKLEDEILSILCTNEVMARKIREAVRLALDHSVSDMYGISILGEGWVADEALYIAVFCAVRYQDDLAAAVRAAVNHDGDSDSTGAICGNILGAWLGKEAVEKAFDLNFLEMRDVIEQIADDLYFAVEDTGSNGEWTKKYLSGIKNNEIHRSTQKVTAPAKHGIKYTPLTKKAMNICFEAHKEQKDKSGLPYVFHPFHLAEQMETEDEICTALLHDVIEDTEYTLDDLRNEGFPETVLRALGLLTHDDETDYFEYVKALKNDPIAKKVKTADLTHNSDPSRLDAMTDRDKKRIEKYRKALDILNG